MNSRKRRLTVTDDGGLSLVELLIATTIISVAMLGIVGMFSIAHQHLRAGGDVTQATGLAQQMVEVLRDELIQVVPKYHNADTRSLASLPADDPGGAPPFRGSSSLTRWQEAIGAAPMLGGTHQGWGRIEVTPLDRGLLSVTVTVGWPASPTERTVRLTAYTGQQ